MDPSSAASAVTGANLMTASEDMDAFFHSMSDANGNPSYYSPAARAAAAAVHAGYHRPSPHSK